MFPSNTHNYLSGSEYFANITTEQNACRSVVFVVSNSDEVQTDGMNGVMPSCVLWEITGWRFNATACNGRRRGGDGNYKELCAKDKTVLWIQNECCVAINALAGGACVVWQKECKSEWRWRHNNNNNSQSWASNTIGLRSTAMAVEISFTSQRKWKMIMRPRWRDKHDIDGWIWKGPASSRTKNSGK